MMKIRMLQGIAGHDFSWAAGEVVEVADALGRALCDGVRAEPVAPAKPTTPPKPASPPKRGGQPIATATAKERETR